MIDVTTLQQRVPVCVERERSASISYIGVITSDRPPQLRRCVSSYARHIRQHGRTCEFVVLDDSNDPARSRACREWLRTFSRNHQQSIYYAGLREKLEYVQRLSDEGVQHELSRFALFNPLGIASSPGANRNALLLHAAGELFLSLDDDSVCHLGDLRRGAQTVGFMPFHAAGTNMLPAKDRRAAVDMVPVFSGDLLASHEELLGNSLSELFLPIRNTSRINARLIGASLLAELLRGVGKVVVTASGLMGDSGLPDAGPLITLTGEARARLVRFCESGQRIETCRSAVLGVTHPTITQGPVRTTAATAFDNRFLLPPFIPSGRGEDTFFGILLRKCSDEAFIGHVPVAPLHAPPGPRCNALPGAAPRLMNVLTFLLEGYSGVWSHSMEARMRSVGRFIMERAEVDTIDFESFLAHRARQWVGALLEQGEELLETYHCRPVEWAEMLRKWIEHLEGMLLSDSVGLPSELNAAEGSLNERYAKLQKFILEFGTLLYHWPEIMAAARRLRSKGHRVGQLLA